MTKNLAPILDHQYNTQQIQGGV